MEHVEAFLADDIGSRLFHSRFRTQLDEALEDRLFRELSLRKPSPSPTDHAIRQSYMERAYGVSVDDKPLTEVARRVRAQWDGSVGVSASLTGSILKHASLLDLVVAEPCGDLIGSVQRELQRAAGLWSFEGVPDQTVRRGVAAASSAKVPATTAAS